MMVAALQLGILRQANHHQPSHALIHLQDSSHNNCCTCSIDRAKCSPCPCRRHAAAASSCNL